MAASSLSEIKNYWGSLTPVQQESVLVIIKSIADSNERISIGKYNQELKEAEAEYEKGDYISQEQLLKDIKKW